jgi:hypothetical protein|tara:strand:+ start:3268 stop:3873 length:606 start_codon:yes stop_codon:yes gene_type:complete
MTARSPPSTAYDYAPRARLVSLRAPSRRAGGRIIYAPRVNRLRVASRRVDDARSSTIRVTNPRSRRRRVRSPSSRRVASRRVARASRTVVDGLRRHGGADADRHRRAGEIRERVRGGAHGFRSDATRCDDDTSRRVARRARARMGERASQWEHQAQFAGELFVGTSALVGGFLTFMYCHLRAQKRRRDRERLLSRQQEALL